MTTIEIFILILFAHFVADWTLQTQFQCDWKNKSWYVMMLHSFVWSVSIVIPLMIAGYSIIVWLLIVNMIVHAAVDKWKCLVVWNKEKQDWSNFKPWHLYVDQGIHIVQVIATLIIYIFV